MIYLCTINIPIEEILTLLKEQLEHYKTENNLNLGKVDIGT